MSKSKSSHRYGRSELEINGRKVGSGYPCYIIGEAGSNHNGDMNTAKNLIDVAKSAGCDAVKFQTYTAEGLYSRKTWSASYLEENNLYQKNNGEKESLWDLIKRIEIPWEWHAELAEYCAKVDIDFLSTPFELAAVDALEEVGSPAYKIASYESSDPVLIHRAAQTGKPILLSTGMASLGDIEDALDAISAAGNDQVALLHCASKYPAPFEILNLRAMQTLAQAFNVPVGYSDHSPGVMAAVAMTALGGSVYEKHFTLDKTDRRGPDHAFAVEPDELAAIVQAIRDTEAALGSPVKRVVDEEMELYVLARRSLVCAKPVGRGEVITRDHVVTKRPGNGIRVRDMDKVIGLVATRDIEADDVLTWDMFK